MGRPVEPPLTLGVRAARWGALACLIGLGIVAVPFVQGYRMGGNLTEAPVGDGLWHDLMRDGWALGMGAPR